MNLFTTVLYLHIVNVAVSVGLFVLCYWWMYHQSPLLNQRWVRIASHCSNTLLFLNGTGLMAIARYLPFTEDGAWLTEKLFGVTIYITLGFIALGRRRPCSQQNRFITFLLVLVVLFIIIQLAITRIPILGQDMGSLADFEFNKAPLCDGMVLISEQVRDDFPSHLVEEESQRLLRLAQEETASPRNQECQIERLLALFYDE